MASGALPAVDVPTGRLTPLGAIRASLAKAAAPCKLTVRVSLQGTPFANEWEIWVYPAGGPPPTAGGRGREPAMGRADQGGPGRRARKWSSCPSRMRFGQSLPGSFLPVFWSPVWFPTQKPNTMGILCDPQHPVFAQFPTEFYSNWQWYDLLQNSRSMILDETPAGFRPIVQVIDNFARNHKLGNVFEARVGDGRLLVCTIDLFRASRRAARRPAVPRRAFTAMWLRSGFSRRELLDVTSLDKLFAPPAYHQHAAKAGGESFAGRQRGPRTRQSWRPTPSTAIRRPSGTRAGAKKTIPCRTIW